MEGHDDVAGNEQGQAALGNLVLAPAGAFVRAPSGSGTGLPASGVIDSVSALSQTGTGVVVLCADGVVRQVTRINGHVALRDFDGAYRVVLDRLVQALPGRMLYDPADEDPTRGDVRHVQPLAH